MYTAGPYRLHFHRPVLMGILNVTPDSFSDGGSFTDVPTAIAHGRRLIAAGADWIDIGGESTRPGAAPVPVAEELRRVLPVVTGLADAGVPICIDTCKAEVAREALAAGAVMVNDVHGGADRALAEVAAAAGAPYIVMHMQGTPTTMQQAPDYEDVVAEVFSYLGERCARLQQWGVAQLITDPGIGFGKTLAHNLQLMQQLDWFLELGFPMLLGTSRKSWIPKVLGAATPIPERLPADLAAAALALHKGARIFRVHDVASHLTALKAAWGLLLAQDLSGDTPAPWPAAVESRVKPAGTRGA